MSSLHVILSLIIFLFVVGTAYFGIRYLSGRYGSTNISEFILWATCIISLCLILWADLIDTIALAVYVGVVISIRLWVLKRPFRGSEIIFHLVILYLTLSRLDKVTGYGHPNQFLVWAQYLFLITVVLGCVYQIFKTAESLAIGALLLLIFPISHFPLELTRNLVARGMTQNVAHLYVTKLYTDEIYGLRFDNDHWVDRYVSSKGEFQKKDTNLLSGGGGTMDSQIPIVTSWEINIVKIFFDK